MVNFYFRIHPPCRQALSGVAAGGSPACDSVVEDFRRMPDVGLTTATRPLPSGARVVIRYVVEVEGLPVYQESYDVATLAEELAKDRGRTAALWLRRIECVVRCRDREALSACLTRCLSAGKPGGEIAADD